MPFTRAEERVLTPTYAAPEQILGEPVTTATDVYALGAVLYELLSGRPPFQGSSMLDTAAAILRDEPSRLDAPPALAAIVDRCLRKSPASRFQTIAELQAALEGVVRDGAVANKAAESCHRGKRGAACRAARARPYGGPDGGWRSQPMHA